ncbi:GNAT family N-acetyltransferase [Mucilaginibacter paludis]|uniref:GCN5-related N-acetyltransferase n=1 Tax=Mucilaginibacter paludis DSM 18603 TaxID=714943 RepID=H1XZA3_9SPHI|nr:GNAT family N-acetyltransferase [Mucilaginibacter paludis]EHQ25591.1 GCN5-related N-acetyltransferase [Mucilaginibacter paludis DSM 18603]
MEIINSQASDITEILALQKLAYQSEAELYNDYTIQPLMQDESSLLEEFKTAIILKAVTDPQIIGSVRANFEVNTCYIGKLIVSPEWQNKGIGKQLMKVIEEKYGDAERYELFTWDKSIKNMALYATLGYEIFDMRTINDSLTMVFLQKSNLR